jgi:hypothetical protein
VNLVFAAIAGTGAVLLLRQQQDRRQHGLDLPGVLAEGSAMFCIVYGFSNAATHSWQSPDTWGFLAAGTAGLAAFAWWQTRAAHPLLPLRIVLDRDRAAAYLSILIAGAGLFGIFLFLTYYLQQTLGYSPVTTGLAFLPMVACIVAFANLSNIVLLPRIGPKLLVAPGMLLAAGGLAWLTRIGVHSSYPSDVLPSLLVAGAGIGFVVSTSINTATAAAEPSDAGVASALANTGQQVGGSIGTSLLNSVAASATAAYLTASSLHATAGGRAGQAPTELAQVHGYTTAFWWAAGIFAGGAVTAGLLFRSRPPRRPTAPATARKHTSPASPRPPGSGGNKPPVGREA